MVKRYNRHGRKMDKGVNNGKARRAKIGKARLSWKDRGGEREL